MELLCLVGVLCVVAINALAPRLRISAPLLLVLLGVIVSVQPLFASPVIEVESDVILSGVLPLLLFAAAVQMPATNFRRNFNVITGLSVSLVVLSALVLGAFFAAMLPGLGFPAGIAMGAILSPTDAVATGIVKKLGVAPRIVDLLDGEAMLNDASALVLLRSSLAAASLSIGSVAVHFAYSVIVATAIGIGVGYLALQIRKRIEQPTVNTLMSFAVPFVAHIPAEHAGASGLVAVVAAGLVIGQLAPRYLDPIHRINETLNWRTIEMLLEGGLFLVMGLQLYALARDVRATDATIGFAVMLAGLALAITLGVRALYATPLLIGVQRRQRRFEKSRSKLEHFQQDLVQTPEGKASLDEHQSHFIDRVQTRVRRALADFEYGKTSSLGVKDGVLLVWAGMRGAITLAAAETLPETMPHRSLLVLVAFLVATASLLLQGGTLGWVIRKLRFPPPDHELAERERLALRSDTEKVALAILEDPALRDPEGNPYPAETIAMLRSRVLRSEREASADGRLVQMGSLLDRLFDAQRATVLSARADGIYSSEALTAALGRIDNLQIGIQLAKSGQ